MNNINTPSGPKNTDIAVPALIISALSCIGTWLVPYLVAANPQMPPTSIALAPQSSELFLLISDIAWTTVFIIGSLSTWGMVISLAIIIDQVLEFNLLISIISKKRVFQLIAVLFVFYLLISMFIWIEGFSSVFLVLRNQAGAIIIGSILGFLPSGLIVNMASKTITKKESRELSNSERALWAVVSPAFLASWLALATLFFEMWLLCNVILIIALSIYVSSKKQCG